MSSLQPSSVAVQPGLCRTWSETPKTGFLMAWLILHDLRYLAGLLIHTGMTYVLQSISNKNILNNNKAGFNQSEPHQEITTVKFLNFRTPENFAAIYLKFKQRDQTYRVFCQMVQME